MSRRKQLWGVVVGGLFPVALTWATAGAINIEDPWEIREHQVLITAAIPDCPGPLMDGVLAIHGFYFDEPPYIAVTLELEPLTVISGDEHLILAVLPAGFCDLSGTYLLTVTRLPRDGGGKAASSKALAAPQASPPAVARRRRAAAAWA